MVVVPGEMPPTIPEVMSAVPTKVLLLLHVPPADVLLNAVVDPSHTAVVPPIKPGIGLVVTSINTLQPVGNAYVIVDVPTAPPVVMPELEPMVATTVLLLAHVPPAVVLLNVFELDGQR
jgi:hypothetical protein